MHQMQQSPRPRPAMPPGAGRLRPPTRSETSSARDHAGHSLAQVHSALALAPLLCALSGVLDLCVARGVASWIWAEPVLAVVASIVAASAAQLRSQAAELQASRTRIVAAADSERRRIERNLHDGAQQRLAALAIKVSMACELAEHDADQARAQDRKSTRLNSSHITISYAVFCLKKNMLYGPGLRLLECARLRLKDVDFPTNQIIVRAGKGDCDRGTMLTAVVKPDRVRHVELDGS